MARWTRFEVLIARVSMVGDAAAPRLNTGLDGVDGDAAAPAAAAPNVKPPFVAVVGVVVEGASNGLVVGIATVGLAGPPNEKIDSAAGAAAGVAASVAADEALGVNCGKGVEDAAGAAGNNGFASFLGAANESGFAYELAQYNNKVQKLVGIYSKAKGDMSTLLKQCLRRADEVMTS